MLNYGKFYGNFTFPSLNTPITLVVNIPRKPGSSVTPNCYLNTMCLSLEARSPVGFPANQTETSQLIGVTPVLALIRNPSSNWMVSSSPVSTSTDTVKQEGLESGLATKPKNRSSLVVLIVVRLFSLLG